MRTRNNYFWYQLLELTRINGWEENDDLVKKAKELLRKHEAINGRRVKIEKKKTWCKKIKVTDDKGNVTIYDNSIECGKALGIKESTVYYRLRGNLGRHRGYKFEYVKEGKREN